VAAYVASCKSCSRRVEVDWDGDHRLMPFPATCPHCGHADGYREGDVFLVGAFEAECPHCGETFDPEIPSTYVEYAAPTGLRGPLELKCKVCGRPAAFQPEDIIWLGRGPSMPQARPGAVGQQRP
jgi:hypothetical protein